MNSYTCQRRYLLMIILCCLFGLVITGPGFTDNSKVLLDSFFSGAYHVEKMGIRTNTKDELLLVKDALPNTPLIANRALIFARCKIELRIYLMIIGPLIIDGSGLVISDVSGVAGTFYGWKIDVLKRDTDKVPVGLSLDVYSKDGKAITDHPSIIWDNRSAFFVDKIDRSQF
jgi:hypothetical protein